MNIQRDKKIDNKVKVCFLSVSEIHDQSLKRVPHPADVDCFIPKPIELHRLVEIIKAVVNHN